MNSSECFFCDFNSVPEDRLIAQNELAYARWDDNPVNPGHALVIPRRHVESYFDVNEAELLAIYGLEVATKSIIVAAYAPDGFTLGTNEGEAAGRTFHHLHKHLIPRYIGDVANTRGGIRHIIPGKGDYLS